MVQVVEFADAGEAAFQHFHVGLCSDGLEVVRADAVQEAVHQLAPAPEAVARTPAHFGQTGHGALEGVAVQVAQPGHDGAECLVAGFPGSAGGDRGDASAHAFNAHIPRPAVGQQGVGGVEMD
ncbi:hypothetical protein D3C71_1605850 [compost metagenome]